MGFYIMVYYIKIGSITNAQRGRAVLHGNSVQARIKRIENPQPGDGCGYVLAVDGDADEAVRLLKKSGLRVLGVDEA